MCTISTRNGDKMIALHIADIKGFMDKLLLKNVFDNFFLTELEINTFVKFKIKGHLNHNFFSSDEIEQLNSRGFAKWSEIRPYALQIVKGNKAPVSFQIVLQLSHENVEKMIKSTGVPINQEDVTGLYMHFKFEEGQLHIITGTGVKTFTLDKTLDKEWDDMTKKFLKHHEIVYEE